MPNVKRAEKLGAEAVASPSQGRAIPVVSLFCGAGGLDLGFAQAGFKTIFAADAMPQAVETFNANLGAPVAVELDLLKMSASAVIHRIREASLAAGVSPKGLLGGPPCQGVSNANNRAGPHDPRNRLFARYASIVLGLEQELRLSFFVFENVPALVEARKNRPLFERLVFRLKSKFTLHTAILDASDFGVPQTRRRLIVVGLSKRLTYSSFSLPERTTADVPTVRCAIGGLPEPTFFRRGMVASEIPFHPNHWTMQPKSSKFAPGYLLPKDGRSFIKLDWDKQSRTVAYGNREVHVHPCGTRRISVYEAMRLQGFPQDFILLGNFSEQVTQVSNAVPPPLARSVAGAIAKVISGDRT